MRLRTSLFSIYVEKLDALGSISVGRGCPDSAIDRNMTSFKKRT